MKTTMLTALLALCFWATGQILEENAAILSEIQGDKLFELNQGEKLYSYTQDDGWYKVSKEVFVYEDEQVDEEYIMAGTELRNKEGDVIGKAVTNVEVSDGRIEDVFRGKNKFKAVIEGYVFKTKIADGTIEEDIVEQLLTLKNRTEQQAGFKKLFKEYQYEERKFEGFTVFASREVNRSIYDDKSFRVILVFRGESPYAVVTNKHVVKAEKVKLEWEDDDYRAIYFSKPTAKQAELVQDKILYTYVGLE